jgi:hypothetical protein
LYGDGAAKGLSARELGAVIAMSPSIDMTESDEETKVNVNNATGPALPGKDSPQTTSWGETVC